MNSNSIKNKWDAYWWRIYSKSSYEYVIRKNNFKITQM
jgi:hypothetical protein